MPERGRSPLILIGRRALLLGLAAAAAASAIPAAARPLRVVFTAELRGNLLPCPCPDRPLGGIVRRTAWIDSLRAASDEPLLVLDAGGVLPRSWGSRDDGPLRLVRSTFSEGLRRGGYDAINAEAPPWSDAAALQWLRPGETRRILREGIPIEIQAVSERGFVPGQAGRAATRPEGGLRILLCDGDINLARAAAGRGGADLAIVARGARYDPPAQLDGVVFVGPGTDGKYVGEILLDVTRERVAVVTHRLRPMDGTIGFDRAMQSRLEEALSAAAATRPDLLGVGE